MVDRARIIRGAVQVRVVFVEMHLGGSETRIARQRIPHPQDGCPDIVGPVMMVGEEVER
jgi:hypothetical protein